jgi:hypothetical protein
MPQIILHPSDLDETKNKDQTRKLVLQSIVTRENQEVAEMITDAARQGQIADSLTKDIQKMNKIVSTLLWAANAIYNIITVAYIADTSKTNKYATIQKEAKDQM